MPSIRTVYLSLYHKQHTLQLLTRLSTDADTGRGREARSALGLSGALSESLHLTVPPGVLQVALNRFLMSRRDLYPLQTSFSPKVCLHTTYWVLQ